MSDRTDIPKDLGVEIGGPGRVYFDDVVIDNMFDALLELSAALWTVRDRQIVTERVLADKGIDLTDAIEAYLPDDQDLAARKAEREEMVERVFKAFLRRPDASAAKSPDDPSLRDIVD